MLQSTTTTATLTAIWSRVLQKPSIRPDSNFFSLGGSLRSADLLFAEIAQEFGRELPSATIYHAQTISQLAPLLEQPTLPAFSPLVKVKTGDDRPPILMVHGLAGTVPFFELSQHIQTSNPVYGFQAKGVDGLEDPLDSVEDMAALYLESIKSLLPQAQLILIGYSFGGLVALEMAQRLIESEDSTALLIMVDAYPDPRFLSPVQRLRLLGRRSRRYLFEGERRFSRALGYVAPSIERRLRSSRKSSTNVAGASSLSFARTTLNVKEKAYTALARYRPQFYHGQIKFLKSESDSYYPANPVAVWSDLSAQFDFEVVPGGHLDMITSDFASLAAVLTRYVEEAPVCIKETART